MSNPALPLQGIRILDLSTVVAGPFGAEMLGELGADVIRIESPPAAGMEVPGPEEPITESDGFFYALQRNKRAICLDLKHPRGKQLFFDLVAKSDVVWDNFRPGVMARLGFTQDILTSINPGIVTCSISGYGSEGPWSRVGAYDITIQALSGVMSITGDTEPDSEPCRWGVPIGDITGSLYGVIGVLAALDERLRTQCGQHIEISLLDAQLALNTYRVPQAFGAGVTFAASSPRRGGAGAVPYGPFRAGCGKWITIGVSTNFWRAFCEVIGRPALAEDARFSSLSGRQANQSELDKLLEEVFLNRPASDWFADLVAAKIPSGLVNDIAGAFAQPQAVAREMAITLTDLSGRKIPAAASPLRFEGEPSRPQRPPSRRGFDTRTVLDEVLGLNSSTVAELENLGVISTPAAMEGRS